MSKIQTPVSLFAALLALVLSAPTAAHEADAHNAAANASPRWSFAIHGGAGTMERANMTDEQQADYKAALQATLDAGSAILRNGGTAAEAVKTAIVMMEDDPKFNAGRGAVFTWEGANELDAAIMLGESRAAGAVTGITSIKNPILLADAVMEDGRHVFLSGVGAEEFAADADLATAPAEWFA
ncbi:MAG: isoaspartyl peptidase/L-asparaginase, partial [Pontixanthobacter sp.]